MNKNYDDIINLPHHVSKRHPQMSVEQRAAQFASFATLTGYEEQIEKTGEEFVKKYEENLYFEGWYKKSKIYIKKIENRLFTLWIIV